MGEENNINWHLLSVAYNHYQQRGYQYVETPWVVPQLISQVTKPHQRNSFLLTQEIYFQDHHELVGSAEQGFIYLLKNGLLNGDGPFFSISPCFRDEAYDALHQPWFMKLELFSTSKSIKKMNHFIEDALDLFSQFIDQSHLTVLDVEDTMKDINCKGIELGSYGHRTIEDIEFHYGTGIALPRFSIACQ